jgi:hypothetical protein
LVVICQEADSRANRKEPTAEARVFSRSRLFVLPNFWIVEPFGRICFRVAINKTAEEQEGKNETSAENRKNRFVDQIETVFENQHPDKHHQPRKSGVHRGLRYPGSPWRSRSPFEEKSPVTGEYGVRNFWHDECPAKPRFGPVEAILAGFA